VVLQRRGDDRQLEPRVLREEVDVVLVDVGRERRPTFVVVGDQLAKSRRIEHRPRELMGPCLARFLQNRYRQGTACPERSRGVLLLELRQPQGRR
jgi:hypothetical protein